MIELNEAQLKAVSLHKIGNKVRGEGITAAESLYPLDEQLQVILRDFFLRPFKNEELFKFIHSSDLALNEVYTYCKSIFSAIGTGSLLEESVHILRHLYEVSLHPQILGGELYVAYFKGCEYEGQEVDAIGIFKNETKDLFLRLVEESQEESNDLHLVPEQGINLKKMDKGCLIFNVLEEDGYSLLLINKDSEETRYWTEDFLNVVRVQDNAYHTDTFLDMTKEFCEDIFSQEEDKKEQVVFMNKSINYFSKNKEFDLQNFQHEVLGRPDYIEKFDSYRQDYESEQGLNSEEGFAISKYAVRKKKKDFKSILKLDSQIEIHLKTKDAEEAADFMERGFDELRGMYYYKVYFNQELE